MQAGSCAARWATRGPPLKDVGFRFRTLTDGAICFDEAPQRAPARGKTTEFEFFLFESPDEAAANLDMDIEVYAVNADRERGMGTRLHLHAPPAPAGKRLGAFG